MFALPVAFYLMLFALAVKFSTKAITLAYTDTFGGGDTYDIVTHVKFWDCNPGAKMTSDFYCQVFEM